MNQSDQQNQYLHLVKSVAILLALLFVLDFGIGHVLRYFYFKQESGLQYRTTYSLNDTKADLLVFGSSRANHHYYPKAFEEGLNTSYYNVGRDGSYIFYHYAILQGVLKRYRPRIVILDFMRKEFMKEHGSYDWLSSLLPYYKSHPEIRSVIQLRGPFEKIKLMSQIYPYNSSLLTIAIGNTEMNKVRNQDENGYVPLYGEWNEPLTTDSKTTYELDTVKVKYYEMFIKDCLRSGVKLIVVCSPDYVKELHDDASVKAGMEIAARYRVPFLNFLDDSEFSDRRLFADKDHLNNNGAIKFSGILVKDLKEIVGQPAVKPVLSND